MKNTLPTAAAAFVAAFAVSANATTYTSASYAQREHLMAQWDAIDNVGTGTHDPTARVWKNLAGTGDIYDLTLTNSACWKNGDRLVVNRTSAVGTRGMPGYKTIEVVFRATMGNGAANGRILFTSGDGEIRQLVVFDYGDYVTKGYFSGKKNTYHQCVTWHNEADNLRSLRSMAGVFTNANATTAAVYGDGIQRTTTVSNDFWTGNVMMIGARQNDEFGWAGEVSTIRIYDCELTAEEIAQNHVIDVARFGEQLPASSDYVQDGLLVQWDGIDNAGTGVHDPAATTWKNLASSNGAYDLTLAENGSWNPEGRALVVNGLSASAAGTLPEYKTIEVVCKRTNKGGDGRILFNSGLRTRFIIFDSAATGMIRAYFSGDTADDHSVTTKYIYQPFFESEINFLAGRYDDNGKVTDVFKDADQREDGARGNSWNAGAGITIGGRVLDGAVGYRWYGEVYAIRLYSRRLTKAELAHNYRLDCKRFLTSSSYLQEGLTAHWDGTDNVGRGQHDSSTKTWKNLVSGGIDLTIGSGVWTDTALMSVGSSTMAATGTNYQAYNTLEVVLMNANHDWSCMPFSAGLANRYLALAGNRVQWRNSWGSTSFSIVTVGRYSLTGILTDESEAAYANGAKIQYGSYSDNWNHGESYVQVGGRLVSGSYYAFTGDIFAIRTYSNTFTPEKVAYNYKVDRRRFSLDANTFKWASAGDGFLTNRSWTVYGQATAKVPGASDAVTLPAGDYAVTLNGDTVVEALSVGAGAKLKMVLPHGDDATNAAMLTVFGGMTAASDCGIVLDAQAFGKKHADKSITLVECETDSAAALQAMAANISFVNTESARQGSVAVVDGRCLVYTAPQGPGLTVIIR